VALTVAMTASLLLLFDASTGFGGFAGILIPLFFYIGCHGFVLPNTTALAMAPHGRVAGSASALLGTIQFVLASLTGTLLSRLANGTAIPLAGVIAGCGVTAFVIHHVAGRRSAVSQSAGSAA
jgi:DHA1 family bicyclomycin/chloramphenicol resistance-like MFS transporter